MFSSSPSLALRDAKALPPPLHQERRTIRFLDAMKRVQDDDDAAQSLVDALDVLLVSGGFVCRERRFVHGSDEAAIAQRAIAFVAPLIPFRLPSICPITIAQGTDAAARLVEHVWFWGEWDVLHPDEQFELVGCITVLRNAAENVALHRKIKACVARQRVEAHRQRVLEGKRFGVR